MSIICIKGGQVAWDSAVSTASGTQLVVGATDSKMRAMRKQGQDILVGGVGSLSAIHDFQQKMWKMPDNEFHEWWAEGTGSADKDSILIVYNPKTKFIRESSSDSSNLYGIKVESYALGAGWQVATGALLAGASPREAVRIVADRVFGCGGDVLQYEKGKIKRFK
jgi:hypothetical protein